MPRIRSISEGSEDHALARSLRAAYLLMHRRVDALFAPVGVTADQFVLLTALAQATTLTQRELADRIVCDENTLRAMLVLLENKALVRREVHPDDGRARLVSLTDEGERLQSTLWEQSEAFRQNLIALLGPTDSETLVVLLRRLAQALLPKESSK
jgi:DNA-binding MarR family transcriptional regulator